MEMVVKGFWVGGFRCLGGFLGDGCFLWGVGVGLVGWGGVGWWNGMGGGEDDNGGDDGDDGDVIMTTMWA